MQLLRLPAINSWSMLLRLSRYRRRGGSESCPHTPRPAGPCFMIAEFSKLATAIDDVQRRFSRYAEARTKVTKLSVANREALVLARAMRDTAYRDLRRAVKTLAMLTASEAVEV